MNRLYRLTCLLVALAVPAVAAASPASCRPQGIGTVSADSGTRSIASAKADTTRTDTSSEALAKILGVVLVAGLTLPRTRAMDKTVQMTLTDDVRANQAVLLSDVFYASRNRSGTTAPGITVAGTSTKVKTANNTTFLAGGVPKALNATDNLWTLTGGVLAVSSFRKYRLLHDGTSATVQASSDASTAAACDWDTRPADGVAILGIVTVATDGTHTFTPGTTGLDGTGITDTYQDGSDGSEFLANKLTP